MHPMLVNWGILAVLALIWGSSFILIKKGLVVFSSEQVALMRIFFSLLAIIPLLPSSIRRIKQLHQKKELEYLPLIAIALCGTGIPPFLFTAAQVKLDSGVTGILNSLTPLFTLIIGLLLFGTVFYWRRFLGVCIGFIGAVSLMVYSLPEGNSTNYIYSFYIVVATIFYGMSVNLIKTYAQDLSATVLNSFVFLSLGPLAGAALFMTDFVSLLNSWEAWKALGYIVILAVLGTAYSTLVFFKLVQRTNALFAAMVTYLIPIIAVGWGWVDGEPILWEYSLSMIMILGGVYLAGKKMR